MTLAPASGEWESEHKKIKADNEQGPFRFTPRLIVQSRRRLQSAEKKKVTSTGIRFQLMPKKFTMSLFNFTSLDTYAKHSFHSNSRVKNKLRMLCLGKPEISMFSTLCVSLQI